MIAGNTFFRLFLCVLLAFTACKKDDTTTPVDNNPQENFLSLFRGDTTQITFPQSKAINASGKEAGVGYTLTPDSTGATITLAGMGLIGSDSTILVVKKRVPKGLVGTYDLNFTPVFLSQGDSTSTFYGTVPQFFASLSITDPLLLLNTLGTGKLQITKYDAINKRIWGTFSFTSTVGNTPKAVIKRGVFNGIPQVD